MATPYSDYLLSQTRDYNPDTGPSFVYIFGGTEAKMAEIATYYELAGQGAPIGYGYKTSTSQTPMGWILTVRIPDTILYTERWHVDTEEVSIPIWWSDDVRAFLPDYAGLDLTDQTDLRVWMRRIGYYQAGVNAIRRGIDPETVFGGAGSFSPSDYDLMFLALREGEYLQWKRPVLKRHRYVPVSSADRTSLVGPQYVFRTADLVDYFGIPDDVVAQIETVDNNLPAEYPFTIWGWKERRNDVEALLNSGKILEVRDWVYGRWSQITHYLFTT